MSFLIRRNLPRAWAGWGDNFARPPESPAKQPWGHYGDNKAFINSLEELQIPASFGSLGQGPSYEFQPYTKNYGMEWEMFWPVSGLAAQRFNLAILGNWAKTGGSLTAGPLIQCVHAPAGVGSRIYVFDANSVFDWGSAVADGGTTAWGGACTLRVWIDDDKLVRVWRDNTPVVQCVMPASHRSSITRRGMNFFNDSLAAAYLRWIRVYDRVSDINQALLSGPQWVEVVYDNFERPDGAVGNGWTQYGANAGIVSGAWSTTGTTNGHRGLWRDTGITNGTQRIEGTINPGSITSGLVLRGNSTGDSGVLFTLRDNRAAIGRLNSSISGESITAPAYVIDTGLPAYGSPVVMAACVNGDYAWIEIDGVVVTKCQLYGGPAGTWAGAFVQRDGSNSPAWSDLRILRANI